MTLGSKGHEEVMRQFEAAYRGYRIDREDKSLWPAGHVYCDGTTNMLFLAYRKGVAYGLAIEREG